MAEQELSGTYLFLELLPGIALLDTRVAERERLPVYGVLDVIEQENLVENAREVGDYLLEKLKEMQQTEQHIVDVRGRGLMIGIELDVPHKDVRSRLLFDDHIFTGCASTNILRLLPPLCFSKTDADTFLENLKKELHK